MSDDWKRKNGLSPQIFEANGRHLNAQYDNLEMYLNGLVGHIVEKQK